MITKLSPMLAVANLQRSIDFYVNALGFRVSSTWGPDDEPCWAMVSNGTVEIMLTVEASDDPPRAGQTIFYFYPDDVLRLHEKLSESGLVVSKVRETAYGMREFDMLDPDGHRLWFGEESAKT
ncbi:MAG: VOC family protein [Phycisphaerae bacterium]